MKEMASRLGIKQEQIYNKYETSFNNYVKAYWNETKAEILEMAKKDPSMLKADPVWMEKLKDPDGFTEYVTHFEVDLSPETFHKYPELNRLFLDTDPEQAIQNFSDMYFNGLLNEERLRLYPHVSAMKEYLDTFEKELDETGTITNEMWVTKLKDDTYNYIKTVLDPEFQKESMSYAKTQDNMRVDIGLMVSRAPIFVG
jgi:hypothetical protein